MATEATKIAAQSAAKEATRAAFGETLVELCKEGLDVVAVDADLAGSTTLAKLASYDPDRLVDVGIAEQNMVGVAAGLSVTGRIAFTGSFAVFGTGRCYDQIRNTVADANLNVKICPTHAGITVGEDGATHQMLEDISLMRGLPNMRVLVPADFHATKACLKLAAKEWGPVYVRMGRYPVAPVYDSSVVTELEGANVLREGAAAGAAAGGAAAGDGATKALTIFACGVELSEALQAADILAEKGIEATVVDVYCIKPINKKVIVEEAKKTGRVLTVEEHSIYGGLGSAVAEVLSENSPTPVKMLGMTTFGTSAPGGVVLHHFGLDAEGIARAAEEFCA